MTGSLRNQESDSRFGPRCSLRGGILGSKAGEARRSRCGAICDAVPLLGEGRRPPGKEGENGRSRKVIDFTMDSNLSPRMRIPIGGWGDPRRIGRSASSPPGIRRGRGWSERGRNGRSRKVVDSTRHGNLSLRLRIPSACGGQDVHAPGGTSARMRLNISEASF